MLGEGRRRGGESERRCLGGESDGTARGTERPNTDGSWRLGFTPVFTPPVFGDFFLLPVRGGDTSSVRDDAVLTGRGILLRDGDSDDGRDDTDWPLTGRGMRESSSVWKLVRFGERRERLGVWVELLRPTAFLRVGDCKQREQRE